MSTGTLLAASSEVTEGALHAVKAKGASVLLSRVDGQVRAVENRCPHFGMPMTKGTIAEGIVRCPWHGSEFDICSGKNMDWVNAFLGVSLPSWTCKVLAMGKEPAPLTVLAIEERDGEIFLV
ncbi:MAG: Rieske (2Fe-2S) protein [Gammaproteobacteria bacterium]